MLDSLLPSLNSFLLPQLLMDFSPLENLLTFLDLLGENLYLLLPVSDVLALLDMLDLLHCSLKLMSDMLNVLLSLKSLFFANLFDLSSS